MKTITFGDIHGRTVWKQVVEHTRLKSPGEVLKTLSKDIIKRYDVTMKELWRVDALPDMHMVIEDGVKEMRYVNMVQ